MEVLASQPQQQQEQEQIKKPGLDSQGNAVVEQLKSELDEQGSLKRSSPGPLRKQFSGTPSRMSPEGIRKAKLTSSGGEDLDPVSMKLESALKRSIADRTGNASLKEEAAREQSKADKMGARTVLSRQQQERAKKEAEQLRAEAAAKQSLADRTGDAALKKEAAAQQHLADKLIANANRALAMCDKQEALATSSESVTEEPVETEKDATLISQPELETIKMLKIDAALKQSMAARSGDEQMRLAAAKEQSRADKARIAAMRLEGILNPAKSEQPTPVGMSRQGSGGDISLPKKNGLGLGLQMSKVKSANNVSLPLNQRQQLIREREPHPAAQQASQSQTQPETKATRLGVALSRQNNRSAGNVSLKDKDNERFYKLPKSSSGNDISLGKSSSQSWAQSKPWVPPPTSASPSAAQPFYKRNAERHSSPLRSDAQLSWRKPSDPAQQHEIKAVPQQEPTKLTTEHTEPKLQELPTISLDTPTSPTPSHNVEKVLKDASTNTDFVERVIEPRLKLDA